MPNEGIGILFNVHLSEISGFRSVIFAYIHMYTIVFSRSSAGKGQNDGWSVHH